MPRDRARESGVLRVEGRAIIYESRRHGSFSIPIAEVAVIGEFTTDNGPFVEDWFLVFVRRGGDWFEASMYGKGSGLVLGQLSAMLGADLHHGLAASADFASRVIWPAGLAGHPLFEFRVVSGSGLFRRLKLALLPEVRRDPTAEVLATAGGIA